MGNPELLVEPNGFEKNIDKPIYGYYNTNLKF
jgi:hypothetical protein